MPAMKAFVRAVAAEPDSLRHKFAEMPVELVLDFLYLLVLLVGETAGQIDENVGLAVAEHLFGKPRHEIAKHVEHPQGQQRKKAHQRLDNNSHHLYKFNKNT